jgi:DNA replication factor GINS
LIDPIHQAPLWDRDPNMIEAQDIVKAHTTGYNLEEVKITLNHDIKLNISGIEIEGKLGEMLNVPRWIAQVLESEKHAKIEDVDMLKELKQADTKEDSQGDFNLATLDPHFYIRMKSYLKTMQESDYEKVKIMLYNFVRKRRGKIIRISDSSKLTSGISQKLTLEERLFYENINKSASEFENQILGDLK